MTSSVFHKGGLAFLRLSQDDAAAILARNHVGRMAFAARERVDIEPVHYVYADGWIYGRTGPGTKLDMIGQNPLVAFEVDEHEGMFDWRSVVVKGRFEVIITNGMDSAAYIYNRAVELLRQLVPETLTGTDRTPFRSVVFRIHLDEITGREARSESEVAVSATAAFPPATSSLAGSEPGGGTLHGVLAAVHTDAPRYQPVLRVATHLAMVLHSRLTVLSILEPVRGQPAASSSTSTQEEPSASAAAIQETTDALDRAVAQTAFAQSDKLGRDAYAIRVITGEPDYEIASSTIGLGAAVLVIGRGQVGGSGKVLNTLLNGMRAARVCEASPVPVVAVADPGDSRHPLSTTVIVTDLSTTSWNAAVTAVHAAPAGAQIHVVRVVDRKAANDITRSAELEAARSGVATWSAALMGYAPSGAQLHTTVLEGDPYEAVTAFLPTVGATCVAVGGHRPRYNTIAVVGRTLPERLLATWRGSIVFSPYSDTAP